MVSPTKYVREVTQEIHKVSWPSREQTIMMTTLVVVTSVGVGLYIGLLDFLFERLLGIIL